MILDIGLLLVGFVILIKGADWLVTGASALARRHNISDLAIGLTVVAFGTSAPELVVNLFASIQDHQAIAFGNVIGSNNFNLFLISGHRRDYHSACGSFNNSMERDTAFVHSSCAPLFFLQMISFPV
ncbi:MAG: hypothetical protein R2758_08425 [Bacteroidales bacterium]